MIEYTYTDAGATLKTDVAETELYVLYDDGVRVIPESLADAVMHQMRGAGIVRKYGEWHDMVKRWAHNADATLSDVTDSAIRAYIASSDGVLSRYIAAKTSG